MRTKDFMVLEKGKYNIYALFNDLSNDKLLIFLVIYYFC